MGFQRQRGAGLLPRHRREKDALVLGVHIAVEARRGADADGDVAVALAVAVEDVQQVPRPG